MKILVYILLILSSYLLIAGANLIIKLSKKFNHFSLKLSGFETLQSSKSEKILGFLWFVWGVMGITLTFILLVFNNISTNLQFILVAIYFITRILDRIILSRLE